MTAVTQSPVRMPATLPVVNFPRRERSCPPARRSRAWPIIFMPKRNKLNPPISVSALKMSINLSPDSFIFYVSHIFRQKSKETFLGVQKGGFSTRKIVLTTI